MIGLGSFHSTLFSTAGICLFLIMPSIVLSDSRVQAPYLQTAWLLPVPTQVTLAGYGFAFRYSPGGRHVAYVEGSRSPHEGDLEFISMDVHKGCGKRPEKGVRTLETRLSYKGSCRFSQPWTADDQTLESPQEVMTGI